MFAYIRFEPNIPAHPNVNAVLSYRKRQHFSASNTNIYLSVVTCYDMDNTETAFKDKHGVWGPYTGVEYNLTLCRLQSRLQHMYHAWALGNPNPVDLSP